EGPALVSPAVQRRLNELQAVYLANQLSSSEYHRQRARILAEAIIPPSTNQPAAQAARPNGVPATALVHTPAADKPASASTPPTKPPRPKHRSGEALMGAELG